MVATCTETETTTAKRPKRPVSEAKLEVNIASSKSSTGPRTAHGKAVASLNVVTDGMTSNTIIFLPGEVRGEFYQQIDRWVDQLGAVTEPEYLQLESAVYHFWKFRRAGNASAAAVTRNIESTTTAFERDLERYGETGSSERALREEGAGERNEATVPQVSGVKMSCDGSSGALPGVGAVPVGAGFGAGRGGLGPSRAGF